MLVADRLHFEMPRVFKKLLDVDSAIAECCERFLSRAFDARTQLFFIARHTHAATTTARGRFHDDGVTDFACDLDCLFNVFDCIFGARKHGSAGATRHLLATHFVTEQRHRFRARSDELKTRVTTDFCKVRVLAEEAVSRMDRIGVRHFGGGDDAVDAQVALRTRSRTDADREVSLLKPRTLAVGGGIHTDSFDAERLGCANDAQGDFATICDKNSLEHKANQLGRMRYSAWPNSTG